MKYFIRFPLLALLALVAVEGFPTSSALAGENPTTPATDASSLGVNYAPSGTTGGSANGSSSTTRTAISNNSDLAAEIKATLASAATRIANGGEVVSPTGQTLSLTPAQAAAISQALLLPADASPATIETAANNLADLIAADLPAGITIDAVSMTAILVTLNVTPANLPAAIAAINALVDSLSLEELKAIANSSTFAAVREIVVSANSVIANNP